jgi:hypothetical protein
MRIQLSALEEVAKTRPAGYMDDVKSRGKIKDGFLFITTEQYRNLLQIYNPEALSAPIEPVKPCCGQSPEPLKMPPLHKQARNLIGAMGRGAGGLVNGEKINAPIDVIESRQAICASCEYWQADSKRCSICGCKTNLKISLASESCPKGFWTAIEN